MAIESFYRKFYNKDGILASINDSATGKQLIFDPAAKTFDEANPLTVELRQRESAEGENLDLSDQSLVINALQTIRLNTLIENDRLTPLHRFPVDINYNTGLLIGLTTQTIDYFGLRVAQIFYQNIDPETEAAITPLPVVYERYKYIWDAATKLPLSRVKEIQFYHDDNTLTAKKKLLPKEFYNTSDRADIVTRRRQTIVSWLIARANELGMEQQTKDYFALYKDQTDKYILYGEAQIITTVSTSTEAFLDDATNLDSPMDTMRNAIITSLTKALEATPDAEVAVYLSAL